MKGRPQRSSAESRWCSRWILFGRTQTEIHSWKDCFP